MNTEVTGTMDRLVIGYGACVSAVTSHVGAVGGAGTGTCTWHAHGARGGVSRSFLGVLFKAYDPKPESKKRFQVHSSRKYET